MRSSPHLPRGEKTSLEENTLPKTENRFFPAAGAANAAVVDPTRPTTRPNLILAICCMSLLIVGMDVTIVNVALPAIRKTCMRGWRDCSGFWTPTRWWWRVS